MSSDNRANYPTQPPPIYTVYPGGYQDQPNYGFHQAPPPRYEDAIKDKCKTPETGQKVVAINPEPFPSTGLPTAPTQQVNEEPQQTSVLLVSPVYAYLTRIMLIRFFCSLLLIIFFVFLVTRLS